jgi:hypothetical protein
VNAGTPARLGSSVDKQWWWTLVSFERWKATCILCKEQQQGDEMKDLRIGFSKTAKTVERELPFIEHTLSMVSDKVRLQNPASATAVRHITALGAFNPLKADPFQMELDLEDITLDVNGDGFTNWRPGFGFLVNGDNGPTLIGAQFTAITDPLGVTLRKIPVKDTGTHGDDITLSSNLPSENWNSAEDFSLLVRIGGYVDEDNIRKLNGVIELYHNMVEYLSGAFGLDARIIGTIYPVIWHWSQSSVQGETDLVSWMTELSVVK